MGAGVVDEVRVLYKRGDHEGVVARTEQLLHRGRGSRETADRPVLSAARVGALVHLGRTQAATTAIHELKQADDDGANPKAVGSFVDYTRPYLSWASNRDVAEALSTVEKIAEGEGVDSMKALQAQLLYRLGRYEDASAVYQGMYDDVKAAQEKAIASSKPAQAKSWGLSVRRTVEPVHAPVSQAEIDNLKQNRDEIGANLMAALVLAGRPSEALALKAELGDMYEVEYNAGCALIAAHDWEAATSAMGEAERLYRDVVDDEEEDVDRGLAPILVQRAYLGHVAGNVEDAEQKYAEVVKKRNADAASLAVAANNLAVATGQLANVKEERAADGKQQGNALFDALKRMKATSGWDVERKLTFQQRRAMARNRAVLLVQMGRLDACRGEVDRMKSTFDSDPHIPLIETALVAKSSSPADAIALLEKSDKCDKDVLNAARIKLTLDGGESVKAAKMLEEQFAGRAAALATAAAVLEKSGHENEAIALLERVTQNFPQMADGSRRALAGLLLRTADYERAASVLRDLLNANPGDDLVLGQLVVATSYCDPDESERLSERLPVVDSDQDVDVTLLESKPAPRKRDILRSTKGVDGKDTEPGDAGASGEEEAKRKPKSKKKKKKRLPKDYDPNGPPPDPERWLPKTLRSSYKKKRRNKEINFRGAQGADAASADAAAAKNAERSAARAAESANDAVRAPGSNVPKGTKNKKKSRRR